MTFEEKAEIQYLEKAADKLRAQLAAAETRALSAENLWRHAEARAEKAECDEAQKRAGILANALELIARTPDTVEDKVLRETAKLARAALAQQAQPAAVQKRARNIEALDILDEVIRAQQAQSEEK